MGTSMRKLCHGKIIGNKKHLHEGVTQPVLLKMPCEHLYVSLLSVVKFK